MELGTWMETFSGEFSGIAAQIVAWLPRLLLAIGIMIAGWLVAKLVRWISTRLLLGLDRLWHRVISRGGLQQQLQPRFPPAQIAGEILFWFVVLFFLAGAAAVLGLEIFVAWISTVATYIPILLSGLLIILAGVIISAMMRDLVATAAEKTGVARSAMLGRIVQITILITATAIGVEQIGINITFLSIIMGITLATGLGGVALAFGIGARDYMGNVIAGHQVRKICQVGDRLRLGDHEGTIIELTPTRVILSTELGRVVIPARLFESGIVELMETPERENR